MKLAAAEELFNQALELATPAERDGFLRKACGADDALREKVERLLAAHEGLPEFLADTPGTVTHGLPLTEAPGTVIGRYKLREKIGEGGCGVVYVAEQTEPVRRRVALKVIKLGMDTKQVVARFEAERQALALMDHPYIAKVLDAGTTETGRPYFVMELVRGIKITEYCDQHQLTTKARLDLFIKVCQAVQHAHQKGVIHRDLKPSNILVTVNEPGSPGVPKVIDFGIAKATGGRLTDLTIYTDLHQFIGTPAYMSPEQATLTSLDIDTRSDIYSLGVLLYELLTGHTPFDTKELLALGLEDVRRTIREQEPLRPSRRLETMLADDLTTTAQHRASEPPRLIHLVRGDLDWIVMRCLEKDRTRRYETANGLAFDLQRHLHHEPVLARPPSTAYQLQKAWRRNKLFFTAVGVVAVALVAGISVSTWQAVEASRARDDEKQQRLSAQAAQQAEQQAQLRAKQAQLRAEKAEAEARQNLYAAHMNLALQAAEEQNFGYALSLLDLHRPQPGQADLRGWEWRYLWKLCRSDELVTLGSHSNTVFDAVFSPNGKVLATSSTDHTVKLWDVTAQREIAVLPHDGWVVAAAFAADGSTLATACTDGKLRVWNVATRREIRRVAFGNRTEFANKDFAFSPHAEMFALGEGTNVSVWDVGRGSRVRVIEAGGTAQSLAFSPNGKLLAVGLNCNKDIGVVLWNLGRGEKMLLLTNNAQVGWPSSLAFSPDGKTLAEGCGDGTIKLWDLATAREIQTLTGHSAHIPALAFSADGKTLASASADDTAMLWDLTTGQGSTLHGHLNEVWAIALAPDGGTVATGTKRDGIVALWSTTPKPREQTSQILPKPLRVGGSPGALSPDGAKFLAVYADSTMGLWDTASLRETALPLDLTNQAPLALSPLGKWLAIGEPDGAVRLVETSTSREVANFGTEGAGVTALAFSRAGSKLAVATADHKFRIWDIAGRRVLSAMAGHGELIGYANSFAFSADGGALCATYFDCTAEIFDAATGRRLGFLEGAKGPMFGGAVLLPDGRTVATADGAQDLKLWDLKTQKELATLRGELRAHFALAMSPDGRRLAAGGASPVVRLWDSASHQQVALLKISLPGAVGWLAFSADGNLLVLVDNQETIQTWRAPSWAEIEAAEKKTALKTQ